MYFMKEKQGGPISVFVEYSMLGRKRGSSVVRHLPLVLEVPGSIPARSEENFGV